jgi:hypothetical protein
MLALDFVQRITHRLEEILVGGDDRAVEVELDHGLRPVDGGDLAGIGHAADFLPGDVGRELDDPHRLLVLAENRIVGGLDPDLATILGDPFVLGRLVLAAIERGPKGTIVRAVTLAGRNEHRMVLALDLLQAIAEKI